LSGNGRRLRGYGPGTFGRLVGPEPHRSSQTSVKRSLLVEDDGGALAVIVAPANVRDDKVLEATLDAEVVESPEPTEEAPQHLCLAKGYDKQPTRELVQGRACFPHIRRIGEEKLDEDG
jgi:putative transposase